MDVGPASLTVLVVAPAHSAEHICGVLASDTDITLLGSVDAAGVDDALASGPADIVVIAAGPTELDAARSLARSAAATRFVAVVDGPVDPAALVDAGVGAVVDAGAVDELLVDAVRGIAHGEGFLDAPLAAFVLERHGAADGPGPLSPTEHEVLTRLAAGDSVAALADDYAVTPRLVRLHAGGALSRLLPA
jgi:DNA-binding NarL/FixJ family response regulator